MYYLYFAVSDAIHVFRFFCINCTYTKRYAKSFTKNVYQTFIRNVFINRLKGERFSAFLMCCDSLFHIFVLSLSNFFRQILLG